MPRTRVGQCAPARLPGSAERESLANQRIHYATYAAPFIQRGSEHTLGSERKGTHMQPNRIVALGIAMAWLSIGSALAAGDTLKTGDSHNLDKWYGHAGGLVGSDRVEAIGKATGDRVGVLYDKDVAKRTNMPREDADKSNIAITYDKDVASRTNMQRDLPPAQNAETAAAPHN